MEKRNTVCITGASSGIGAATAMYFLQRGWNVAATMRDVHGNHGLIPSDRLKLYTLDVTSEPSINMTALQIIHDWGSIEAVVNNAGFGTMGLFESADYQDITRQFDVNVFGLMSVTKVFLPHFRNQRRGVFINISSAGGRAGFPMHALYNSSKFAIEGFSESLWHELTPMGIGVKLIEPGSIATNFYGPSANILPPMDDPQYKKMQTVCSLRCKKFRTKGAHPQKVAKVIYKAATGRKQKLRYPVTAEARWLSIGMRFLPQRWIRNIIGRVFLGSQADFSDPSLSDKE